MNLKLENKADYERVITELYEEMQKLKKEFEVVKNSKGGFFKPDIIGKMQPDLADALRKARAEFLPLYPTGKKKDGNSFAKQEDYKEASSKAFDKYGITLTFLENDGIKPTLDVIINLNGSSSSYTITTEVKPANVDNPKMAMIYGFNNARGTVYKTITMLK